MELTITYNKKDYSNYAKDTIFIKRILKSYFKMYAKSFLVLSFFAALMFTSMLWGGLYLTYWDFYLVLVILFIVMFPVICMFALLILFFSGGKFIQRRQQGIKATIKIEITPKDIILDNGDIHSVYKWSAVKDLYNKKYNIVIFISDIGAIIIPKRIFNSEEEITDCWNYLNDCYNNTRNG